MGSTQKLIETAIELQFTKIGYFFDSRHALVEECVSLRERNAELVAHEGEMEADLLAFGRSLMQCLEELDEKTREKFSKRGVGPDAIERIFGPHRTEEPRPQAAEEVKAQPGEGEDRKSLKLVQKAERPQASLDARPATDKQSRLIAKLANAGQIPPGDELLAAYREKATFANATAVVFCNFNF